MVIGSVGKHLLGAAALRPDTGDEQEIVRTEAPDLAQSVGLGRTYHEHHVVRSGNLHHPFHHGPVERPAVLLRELERGGGVIGRQSEDDSPFALVFEEGQDAVLAHVGIEGHGIEVHGLEECLCIHLGRAADVAALGVRDDEHLGIFGSDELHGGIECLHAVHSIAFVEGEIGLVRHAVGSRRLDDHLVEGQYGTGLALE